MATTARIGIIINFVLMVFCVFISARQFAEKGFLFNNAYLFATKDERAKMEKSLITDNLPLCFVSWVQYFSSALYL
mgnify:CR=1 FL=1